MDNKNPTHEQAQRFGNNIRFLMKKHGLDQNELAQKACVTRRSLERVLSGAPHPKIKDQAYCGDSTRTKIVDVFNDPDPDRLFSIDLQQEEKEKEKEEQQMAPVVASSMRVTPPQTEHTGLYIPRGESDSYDRCFENLRRAEHEVWIVGSGFDCTDTERRRIGFQYMRAIAGCAQRVKVRRFETTRDNREQWLSWVGEFFMPCPDSELWMVKHPHHALLKDVILIDPGRPNAVVQLMFLNRRQRICEGPGPEIFIERIPEAASVAKCIRDSIRHRRDAGDFRLVKSPDAIGVEIPEYQPGEDTHHFAYSGNMDVKLMEKRVGEVHVAGVARLDNYRLDFVADASILFSGAVATLTRAEGHSVYGIVYGLSSQQLYRRLDFYAGVDTHEFQDVACGEYVRLNVADGLTPVDKSTFPDGVPSEVWAYQVNPPLRPATVNDVSEPYLGHLQRGAESWGLPDEYRQRFTRS